MVVVDADTGYGNALNVQRTVELWEAAGAAGIFLEDQVWPKRCGHMAGKQVVATGGVAGQAAGRARPPHATCSSPPAPTPAPPLGLDEAIERARQAADLGVDAVFVEAPESIDELEAIAAALPGVTLVANMVETGRTPLLTPAELTTLGFDADRLAAVGPVRRGPGRWATAFARLGRGGTLRDDLDRLVALRRVHRPRRPARAARRRIDAPATRPAPRPDGRPLGARFPLDGGGAADFP